jgi:hypothetical protein
MRKILLTKFISVVIAFTFLGLFILLPSSQVMGSSQSLIQQFPFPPLPELSTTQKSASTNLTCTLRPSLTEVENTPQQIEGPYFVDEMPSRSDIRLDTSDGFFARWYTVTSHTSLV